MSEQVYVGRFAPSPSGPLHFGSLIAALGSYLQAKSQQTTRQKGRWLVRMEDIDPPREQPGAASAILHCLEAHGLHWDGQVTYQSQRSQAYHAALAQLASKGLSYYCDCTRAKIKAQGGFYNGHCRHRRLTANGCALRFLNLQPVRHFVDLRLGVQRAEQEGADFILQRKDGLFAYHLAMVVDDIAQGITDVVRGADLLQPTFSQIALYQALDAEPIRYLHLPLAATRPGYKLSKQNHAPALNNQQAAANLRAALAFLGQRVPHELQQASVAEIVRWGEQNWQLALVGKENERLISDTQD